MSILLFLKDLEKEKPAIAYAGQDITHINLSMKNKNKDFSNMSFNELRDYINECFKYRHQNGSYFVDFLQCVILPSKIFSIRRQP